MSELRDFLPGANGQVAAAPEGVTGQPIGHAETVQGEVVVIRADGTRVTLEIGDPVFQGDVLETGADGAVGLVLADGTVFSMADDASMVLDEMVYNAGSQDGSLAVSVVKGVFTFVSGEIAKADPEAMSIQTPVATIGIRGTQGGIDVGNGETLTVVLMPEADGLLGEIVVMVGGEAYVLNKAEFAITASAITGEIVEPYKMTVEQVIGTFEKALGAAPSSHGGFNSYGVAPSGDSADAGEDLADFDTAAGAEDEAETTGSEVVEFTVTGEDYTDTGESLIIGGFEFPTESAEDEESGSGGGGTGEETSGEEESGEGEGGSGSGTEGLIESFEAGLGLQSSGSVDVIASYMSGGGFGEGDFGPQDEGEEDEGGYGGMYLPTDGEQMAILTAGGFSEGGISALEDFLGLDEGDLEEEFDATEGSAIKVTIDVEAGDEISVDWMFDANDYLPYNDFAALTTSEGDLFVLADVESVGDYGDSGWLTSVFTASDSGPLTIGLVVANVDDTAMDPSLLVDNVQVNRDFDESYQVVDSQDDGAFVTLAQAA